MRSGVNAIGPGRNRLLKGTLPLLQATGGDIPPFQFESPEAWPQRLHLYVLQRSALSIPGRISFWCMILLQNMELFGAGTFVTFSAKVPTNLYTR
jgi:hypothetical protein